MKLTPISKHEGYRLIPTTDKDLPYPSASSANLCKATRVNGEPCRASAVQGYGGYCSNHEKLSPQYLRRMAKLNT